MAPSSAAQKVFNDANLMSIVAEHLVKWKPSKPAKLASAASVNKTLRDALFAARCKALSPALVRAVGAGADWRRLMRTLVGRRGFPFPRPFALSDFVFVVDVRRRGKLVCSYSLDFSVDGGRESRVLPARTLSVNKVANAELVRLFRASYYVRRSDGAAAFIAKDVAPWNEEPDFTTLRHASGHVTTELCFERVGVLCTPPYRGVLADEDTDEIAPDYCLPALVFRMVFSTRDAADKRGGRQTSREACRAAEDTPLTEDDLQRAVRVDTNFFQSKEMQLQFEFQYADRMDNDEILEFLNALEWATLG